MVTPSNPGVAGNSSVEHDGRPDASHEKEVRKAECNPEESAEKESEKGEDLEHSND